MATYQNTPSLFDLPPLQERVPATPTQITETEPSIPGSEIGLVERILGVPSGSENTMDPYCVKPVTIEDLKASMPQNLRSAISQELVDNFNKVIADPIHAENIKSNILTYQGAIKESRFSARDYINAVSYVSFKLMNYTNEEAYERTFPDRYAKLVAKGTKRNEIAAYVSMFHKTKLVNLIMQQCLMPTWVVNQDAFQQAINKQVDLMNNAKSELVQQQAANSLLLHLKKPEGKEFQVAVVTGESKALRNMEDMLATLAGKQLELIQSGKMKTIDVAASRLVQQEDNSDV